ncbi:MAG TPA: XdhC family protein [Blastocatellia bacterium]|nr:XdhC family protein [Blastocatellia bacterium]
MEGSGEFIIRLIDAGGGLRQRIFSLPQGLAGFELPQIVGEKLEDFLSSGRPLLVIDGGEGDLGEGMRLVVERLSERRRLYVFGAGHVGRSVALMGEMLGLDVFLLDDRREFLEAEDIVRSGVQACLVEFEVLADDLCSGRNTAVVIVTRGHQSDEVILRQVSRYEVGYVGMIGSRRRVAGVFKRLRREGVSDQFLSSVKAPIGLAIGAKSPQEIAVSVHAEIIKHFSEIGLAVAG